MKNPGVIIKLWDGRLCICYENQPLIVEKSIVILHLIDSYCKLILKEDGTPKIIFKSLEMYNLENQYEINKPIGFVD